jgi:hypothetical protein
MTKASVTPEAPLLSRESDHPMRGEPTSPSVAKRKFAPARKNSRQVLARGRRFS